MPRFEISGRPKLCCTQWQIKARGQAVSNQTEIDVEQLKKLCVLQCTISECASYLDVSASTLSRRVRELGYSGWKEFFRTHSGKGKVSLRRKQYDRAMKGDGNTQMLIWLGKQYLGQADKIEQEVEATVQQGLDMSKLSLEEKKFLLELHRKAAPEGTKSPEDED